MPNFTFPQPVPVMFRDGKFRLLEPALIRMGIRQPVFMAVGVTPDRKVIPDPNCLIKEGADPQAFGAPINGALCQFEPETEAKLRELNLLAN
jgi:hypothetical protein